LRRCQVQALGYIEIRLVEFVLLPGQLVVEIAEAPRFPARPKVLKAGHFLVLVLLTARHQDAGNRRLRLGDDLFDGALQGQRLLERIIFGPSQARSAGQQQYAQQSAQAAHSFPFEAVAARFSCCTLAERRKQRAWEWNRRGAEKPQRRRLCLMQPRSRRSRAPWSTT